METKLKTLLEPSALANLQALAAQNGLHGLYDVEHSVYHDRNCPGVSQSHLKEILKSPRHYQRWLSEPDSSTAAMDFGSLCHIAILEPDTFKDRIITWPAEIIARTGKHRVVQMREDFRTNNPGKIVADAEQITKVSQIVEFVYSQAKASELLTGLFEKTFFWTSGHGPLCKAKPDCINTNERMILDLKITQDASLGGFKRTASQLGYNMQAAYYLDGINDALDREGKRKTVDRFVFINIEHNPKADDFKGSLDISYTELGEASIDLGRQDIDRALKLISTCAKTKAWPGYTSETQITEVGAWLFERNSNE